MNVEHWTPYPQGNPNAVQTERELYEKHHEAALLGRKPDGTRLTCDMRDVSCHRGDCEHK